jgi:hypothetical protein
VQAYLRKRKALSRAEQKEEAISSIDSARIGVAVTLPAAQPVQDVSKTCCHDVFLIGQIMTGWYKEDRTKSQRRRYIKVSLLVVHKYGITRAYCQFTN